MMLQNDKV